MDLKQIARDTASEMLPIQRTVIKSITKEVGFSLQGHATKVNILRHLRREILPESKKVLKKFKSSGIIAKHRTDTFCWSVFGREIAKEVHFLENKFK